MRAREDVNGEDANPLDRKCAACGHASPSHNYWWDDPQSGMGSGWACLAPGCECSDITEKAQDAGWDPSW